MESKSDVENETLESLIKFCLLKLNKVNFDLTALEVEKANDDSGLRIRELEQDIVDKEKEVSVIKFKRDEEINQLQGQLDEKDLLIKNQEDRIYELDYVNNSLDEIKTYFAEQLREYKDKELSEVNIRLNESYKSIAEKDAQINSLSRAIDEYKIQIIKLENDTGFQQQIMDLENQIQLKNNEVHQKEIEIESIQNKLLTLKQQSVPKDDYDNLKIEFENQIQLKNNEVHQKEIEIESIQNKLLTLKQQSVPKDDYDNLKIEFENEIKSIDNEINRLKENYIPREEYVALQNYLENEISVRDNEINNLKEQTIPKSDYINLQNQLQNEITAKDNELKFIREQTVSREDFINLQNELLRKNDKIKRLEEINAFFNELQEEQETYDTYERTPPFKLEKKQHR